jgi:hypothetical protein
MNRLAKCLILASSGLLLTVSSAGKHPRETKPAPTTKPIGTGPAVLWREPKDIASRDLYYGPGGAADQPAPPFTFEREDSEGTNPKFDVIDHNGVRWRVKLGNEAQPETAASRLVWATGYFVNENYLLPVIKVEKMPHLHRGGNYVSSDGTIRNARLKRRPKNETKLGTWEWGDNPFKDTRQLNGLRTLMAVLNNWDLKDMNNSIIQVQTGEPERRYAVTDLGASFGSTGWTWHGKGNLEAYSDSKLIGSVSDGYVNFNVPGKPSPERFLNVVETSRRLSIIWVGRHIPVADARWLGQQLARLSPKQIADAFRAAGYSPEEVQQLTAVLQRRIGELQSL